MDAVPLQGPGSRNLATQHQQVPSGTIETISLQFANVFFSNVTNLSRIHIPGYLTHKKLLNPRTLQ